MPPQFRFSDIIFLRYLKRDQQQANNNTNVRCNLEPFSH